MKQPKTRRIVSLMLALVIVLGGVGTTFANSSAKAAPPSALPGKEAQKTGVTVYSNKKASVDASNLAEGYVIVKYTGGKDVRIKVQITRAGSTTYTYNLNSDGNAEIFPLTDGDGKYTIRVFENTTGTKYAQAYSTKVTLKLRNDYLPFLYPNQFVDYNADSDVVAKAADLVKKGKATTDLAKVQVIFDFVTDNFTYDTKLAETVQSGYLPVVDNTLKTKTGICFDYSSVMAAMLRSQNIPCKLVVGYAGKVYHAWINVYIEGTGWVEKVIYFDGKAWTMMDPTFVSTGGGKQSTMKYVTNAANYTQKFAY